MPKVFLKLFPGCPGELIQRCLPGAVTNAMLICAALTSGCATTSGVQLAGTAIGIVLEATGVLKKDGDPSKRVKDLSIRIFGGEELNTTNSGVSMSLVAKIYVLRSPERLRTLTYPQMASHESEKEAFGEDLIMVREVTIIPGKSYELPFKVPGDASTIGIVGMYRAPYSYRWKLAFDAANSYSSGIIVGAHACALTASKGALNSDISPDTVKSLVGVQCNI